MECQTHCPITCAQDDMVCPGGVDFSSGCQHPDTCTPRKGNLLILSTRYLSGYISRANLKSGEKKTRHLQKLVIKNPCFSFPILMKLGENHCLMRGLFSPSFMEIG